MNVLGFGYNFRILKLVVPGVWGILKSRSGGVRLEDGEAGHPAHGARGGRSGPGRNYILSEFRRVDHFHCSHELLPSMPATVPHAGNLASFRFQHLHDSAARHRPRVASAQGRQVDHREAQPKHAGCQRGRYLPGKSNPNSCFELSRWQRGGYHDQHSCAYACSQAWSNGRVKSVMHRALVNAIEPRLTVVHFFGPHPDTVIVPPPALVDSHHPLQYRAFAYKEMVEQIMHIRGKKEFQSPLNSFLL